MENKEAIYQLGKILDFNHEYIKDLQEQIDYYEKDILSMEKENEAILFVVKTLNKCTESANAPPEPHLEDQGFMENDDPTGKPPYLGDYTNQELLEIICGCEGIPFGDQRPTKKPQISILPPLVFPKEIDTVTLIAGRLNVVMSDGGSLLLPKCEKDTALQILFTHKGCFSISTREEMIVLPDMAVPFVTMYPGDCRFDTLPSFVYVVKENSWYCITHGVLIYPPDNNMYI